MTARTRITATATHNQPLGMPSPKQGKPAKKSSSAKSKDSPARPPGAGKEKAKKKAKQPPPMEELDDDADIVMRVARMMKSNKLSQVQVGQEARVSQAVISQWLARKYVRAAAVAPVGSALCLRPGAPPHSAPTASCPRSARREGADP